jgi:hypothetical protein
MKLSTIMYRISLGVVLIFASCTGGNTPKNVAEKFLTAFNERKFDEARKYSTPETGKLVDLMENLTKMAPASDSIKPGKIVILDERREGEEAWVTFKEAESDQVEEIKLKKVDGEWLVHVTKEDLAAKDMLGDTEDEEGFWTDEDSLQTEDTVSVETAYP